MMKTYLRNQSPPPLTTTKKYPSSTAGAKTKMGSLVFPDLLPIFLHLLGDSRDMPEKLLRPEATLSSSMIKAIFT